MASKVGERLKLAPIKLRFTTTYDVDGAPKCVLRRSLNQSINEMAFPSTFTPSRVIILYEKLHVSIVKLETKRTVKIIWMGAYNEEESTHLFLSSKTSLVYDLAEHLSERVQLTTMGTGRIRVFEVAGDGRTQQEFVGSEMIGDIAGPDPVKLFAEEIPREELEFGAHDKIVNVFHFAVYVSRTHGVPFKFVVKPVSLKASFATAKTSVNCFHGSKGRTVFGDEETFAMSPWGFRRVFLAVRVRSGTQILSVTLPRGRSVCFA